MPRVDIGGLSINCVEEEAGEPLIVTAKDDVLTPPYFAEALHGTIRGSALHRLDAGGHNSCGRKPAGRNAAAGAFWGRAGTRPEVR